MSRSGRLEFLRKELKEMGLGILLVTDAKNCRYLSGFTGSSGWLVVTTEDCFLITDGRYWDQVARESPETRLFKFVAAEHESLAGALICLLEERNLTEPLGLETTGMSLSVYRSLQSTLEQNKRQADDVESLVQAQREIKDAAEIAFLRKAAEIADEALARALTEFGPGKREAELKALIEYNILMLGGESTSFSTIVASGPNGSYPHAGASQREVQEGELITIDLSLIHI